MSSKLIRQAKQFLCLGLSILSTSAVTLTANNPKAAAATPQNIGVGITHVYARSNYLYATNTAGNIFQYNNGTWTQIGGPGKEFVVDDSGNLYGITPDGNAVAQYLGTPNQWQQIGGPTAHLYAGGNFLYATNPTTGGIYKYQGGTAWTQIGGPGKEFVVDDFGNLYGITPNGSSVFKYSGTPNQWLNIGGAATHLYAGGNSLYKTDSTGAIFAYQSGTSWTKIGSPGKTFTVGSLGQLYGITPDGTAIWEYNGTPNQWTQVSTTTDTSIYAGAANLYGIDQANDLLAIPNPVQKANPALPQGNYSVNFSYYDPQSGQLINSGTTCFLFNGSTFNSPVFGGANLPIVPAPGGWSADDTTSYVNPPNPDHLIFSSKTTGNQINGTAENLSHNALYQFSGSLNNSCVPPGPQKG